MRKTILITLLALLSFVCHSQDEGGPIKFLGIPVDGPKSQFVAKLKDKGFYYSSLYESYKGQFNGKDVDVYVHTNHNLVDRVYVDFPPTNEESIKVEFNRLLSQFKKSDKYDDLNMNQEIPSDEDISYEMTVNSKRYQASFSYFDSSRDHREYVEPMIRALSDYFTEEQLELLSESLKKSLDAPKEEQESILAEALERAQELSSNLDPEVALDPMLPFKIVASMMMGLSSAADGQVWFMIHQRYGRYNIGLYYDNLHNQANGEDL